MRESSRPFGIAVIAPFVVALVPSLAEAQSPVALDKIQLHAVNKPLVSLADAARAARAKGPRPGPPREVPNFRGAPAAPAGGGTAVPDAVLQTSPGTGTTTVGGGFPGATNNDNGRLLGFLVAPPDTDGEVGGNYFVQMINLLTTVYDLNGTKVGDSFPSNVHWEGMGGNCEPYNQGDPIVLYDDAAGRWLVSQFAFPDSLATFSQCVAISQTGDPLGSFNRYEFSFDGYGFNDYPKHGIVTDSVTMIANLFKKRGPFFNFAGTFLGVMDKAAMYGGQTATLLGFNIGTAEFGFVAGDLDGAGTVPALFATAMSQSAKLDIWKIDVNWTSKSGSAGRIASVPVTPFDADLCSASREACIPQPSGGPALEAISDRLMHRLQIRDFGAYRTMVTSHTVDVGNGRAGIRWYELRETGGTWSLHQEGTFGPNDGQHRWMPSVAMNATGDIGLGYLVAGTSTYVSTAVAGQSAAANGTGQLDSAEKICAPGTGVQTETGRSGDYSATSVDSTGTFWHTNEVFKTSGQFQWATYVCPFDVGTGGGTTNTPPTASFSYGCADLACSFDGSGSSDSDGSIVSHAWAFGDGATGSGATASHTYAAGGTYSVTLTVTDDDGATDTETKSVTVTAPTGGITLTAVGRKVRGVASADLAWTGATSTSVDVYRNGTKVTTTANDGAHTDTIGKGASGTYSYQVCEAGTSTCSNTASVTF